MKSANCFFMTAFTVGTSRLLPFAMVHYQPLEDFRWNPDAAWFRFLLGKFMPARTHNPLDHDVQKWAYGNENEREQQVWQGT